MMMMMMIYYYLLLLLLMLKYSKILHFKNGRTIVTLQMKVNLLISYLLTLLIACSCVMLDHWVPNSRFSAVKFNGISCECFSTTDVEYDGGSGGGWGVGNGRWTRRWWFWQVRLMFASYKQQSVLCSYKIFNPIHNNWPQWSTGWFAY